MALSATRACRRLFAENAQRCTVDPATIPRRQLVLAYADQAEKDHAALRAAVRAGIVEVQLEH